MTTRERSGRPVLVSAAAVGLPALALLIAATVSSLHRPLWRDEVATWLFASLSPHVLLSATSHVDAVITPYYFLAHGVHVIIPAAFALRLISVLAATATIVVTGMLALRWWGPLPAFVAGAVIALNPLAFEMAATARPYALAGLFVACAAALLDRALAPGRQVGAWIGYGACVAAIGLTHLIALLTMAATAVLMIGAKRRKIVPWAVSTVVAALIVAPLAITALSQHGQVSWIPRPVLRSAIGSLASVIAFRADGRLGTPEAVALVFVAFALCAGLFLTLRIRSGSYRKRELRRFFFGLTIFLFPWVFLLLESVVSTPYLRTTYLMPTVVGLALALAATTRRLATACRTLMPSGPAASTHFGIAHSRAANVMAATASIVVITVPALIGAGISVTALRAPWWIDDFPGLAAALNSSVAVGDTLVIVQHYSETGVDAGVARASGDSAFVAAARSRLITGTQPELDIRRVISVQPMRTEEVDAPRDGRLVHVVYTRGGFGAPEQRELEANGIDCSGTAPPDISAFGLLRYDSRSCRA